MPTETCQSIDGTLDTLLAGQHLVKEPTACVALNDVGAQHRYTVPMGGIKPPTGWNGYILVTEVAEVIDARPVHKAIIIVFLGANEVPAG